MMADRNSGEGFPWIGAPALGALQHAGYYNLEELTQVTEREIADLHGMGPKALGFLRDALAERGQSFAPEPFPRINASARRALEQAGYNRLEDLSGASESEVSSLHGMGPKAMGILREAMAERDLSFAGNDEKKRT